MIELEVKGSAIFKVRAITNIKQIIVPTNGYRDIKQITVQTNGKPDIKQITVQTIGKRAFKQLNYPKANSQQSQKS